MKYRISLIIAALMLVALVATYIGHETVEVSELENRNMTTFDMVLHPVTDEGSVIYNANKSASDRFEDAMKDQIALRDPVVQFYSDLEGKLSGAYMKAWLAWDGLWQEELPDETEEETDPPETIPEDGHPDEYYDLKEPPAPTVPEVLDYNKYPVYGYALLDQFKKQNYTMTSVGQGLYQITGTDWIGTLPSTKAVDTGEGSALARSVAELEALIEHYPDLKIYNYFAGQICNTPWFNNMLGVDSPDRYEIIAQHLPEGIKYDRFMYDDIEDFMATNYAVDHHWNHRGSERGYSDVYAMMAEDLDLSPMKYPIKEWNFSALFGVQYRGSRSSKLGNSYKDVWDEFIVYEYDLGSRETFAVNPRNLTKEIPITLARWDAYKKGNISKSTYYDHYIQFYGRGHDASGKEYADSEYILVIKNNNGAANNLLIVGDSTQRAYRDVLATHFDTVVYYDYRIINSNKNVPIDTLIDMYDIDALLIGGLSGNYWLSTGVKFTFSDNFNK